MGLVTQASSPNRWREVSSPRLHMVCRSLAGAERSLGGSGSVVSAAGGGGGGGRAAGGGGGRGEGRRLGGRRGLLPPLLSRRLSPPAGAALSLFALVAPLSRSCDLNVTGQEKPRRRRRRRAGDTDRGGSSSSSSERQRRRRRRGEHGRGCPAVPPPHPPPQQHRRQIFKKMDLANHGLILLQQLNAQREFGFLCDCTVAIGDVYFKAHKSVLASFSNYFKMLFVHQTSECVRLKPTDIQPDIFSYLLHLMYTGKMAPQLIDPVRLEQGIKFLHAYPLIQEASLASQGAFSHPDQVFPLASSLYGIQIADHQLRQASKLAPAPEKLGREPRPQAPRMSQEQVPEASQLSQLTSNLAQVNRTHLTPSDPLQTSLSPELVSTPVPPPPPGEETNLEASSSDEQPASLTIAHVKPSIMKRNGSFPKYYACHLCGRRFTLRSSLREHLQIHTGVPFPPSQPGESRGPLSLCSNAADLGKDAMEVPEAGMISDSELQHISDSPIIDGQQHSETPPPSDIADIDNLEQADQEREVKRRKYECTICGRKFIQKSHWREHMYIHTGKPFKCSTCDKSFCRANQAARHVCLNQSIDTYTMVDKQTLELCTFEEGSQMDNMLVQTNKPYKCNLCDKTFSTPNEVVKHSCQNQNSDVFALDEGRSILLGSGDSEVTEPDHPVLASIKKEQETVLLD